MELPEWIFALLFIAVGVYFTVKTRNFPLRHLGRAFRATVFGNRAGKRGISTFSSLCTSLGATVGTGNIVGVASAVVIGGPGALFWMEVTSVLGLSTKFAENVLGALYRQKDRQGNWLGGPFTYISIGLGKKYHWLAKVFALSCLFAGVFGMGTITQSNTMVCAVEELFSTTTNITLFGRTVSLLAVMASAVLTVMVGLVIFGGGKRIAKVSESVVPIMAVGFVVLCLLILTNHWQKLPRTILSVFTSAFTPRAAQGAISGFTIGQMVLLGVQRGIFSNEAGLGTGPIASASAESGDPVEQGYVGVVSVFVDTIVLCTLTGLTVLVTGAQGTTGVEIANQSYLLGLPFSREVSLWILTVFLVVFGFTSILGWNFFTERCLAFLFDSSAVTKVYQCLYLLAVFLGPFLSVSFAWRIADVTNALMATPNLIALLLLRRDVFSCIEKTKSV